MVRHKLTHQPGNVRSLLEVLRTIDRMEARDGDAPGIPDVVQPSRRLDQRSIVT
jgi:hypothetical protein